MASINWFSAVKLWIKEGWNKIICEIKHVHIKSDQSVYNFINEKKYQYNIIRHIELNIKVWVL